MSRTILLADDSVTIQKVVELTFMDQDYEVVAVSDGKAALAKLAEQQPALLIADVHMPGADGYEVCRSSKEIYPDMPVLLLVGTFEPFDEQQAAASGADGHLKKPFDSQDLLAQVEALAGGAAPPPAAEPPAAATADAALGVIELEPPSLTEDPSVPDTAGAAEVKVEPEPFAVAPDSPAPTYDIPAASDPVAGAVGEAEEPFSLPPIEAAAESELMPPSPPAPTPAVEVPAATAEVEVESMSSHTTPIEMPAETVAVAPAFDGVGEPQQAAPEADSEQEMAAAQSPAETVASPAEDSAAGNGSGTLSDQDVDRVARRVAELVGERLLRDVAWEVVPDLAELIIKERIRELESQVE